MDLCHRNCGNIATYINYQGKPCCFKSATKCPTVKIKIGQKNSVALKGRTMPEEHKKKISNGLKESSRIWNCSPETREKISKTKKGSVPWNKGKPGSQIAWNKGMKKQEPTSILLRTDEAYRNFSKYRNRVAVRTKKEYELYKHEINPQGFPLGKAGVSGAYQVDHILSVRQGFDQCIAIEEIASKENLQVIPWLENVQKYDGSRSKLATLVELTTIDE